MDDATIAHEPSIGDRGYGVRRQRLDDGAVRLFPWRMVCADTGCGWQCLYS